MVCLQTYSSAFVAQGLLNILCIPPCSSTHCCNPPPAGQQQRAPGTPAVSAHAALYMIERMFCVLDHAPLLTNLALALLGLWGTEHSASDSWQRAPKLWQAPHWGSALSCRGALLAMLQAGQAQTCHGVVRVLAAVVGCRALDPAVMWAVGLPHRHHDSRPAAQIPCALCSIAAHSAAPGCVLGAAQSRFAFLSCWDPVSPSPAAVSTAPSCSAPSHHSMTQQPVVDSTGHPPIDLSELANEPCSSLQSSVDEQLEQILMELLDSAVADHCHASKQQSQAAEQHHVEVLQPQAAAHFACPWPLHHTPSSPPLNTAFGADLLSALLAMVGRVATPPRAVWVVAQLVGHSVRHLVPAQGSASLAPLYALLPDQQQQLTAALTQVGQAAQGEGALNCVLSRFPDLPCALPCHPMKGE